MQSIILAAGKGSRLGGLTEGRPKCCIEVGGKTLVDRAIELFRKHGVCEQIIVTGFAREQLHERCSAADVTFAFNPFYRTTNTLASLWFGLQHVRDDFLLLNADTIFNEQILERLVAAPGDIVLACDRKPCGDEEVKYRTENSLVVELNKLIPPSEAEGEFLGLSKVRAEMGAALRDCVEQLLTHERFQAYFEAAYEEMITRRMAAVHVLDVGDLPWCEIDFPADYEHARSLFG